MLEVGARTELITVERATRAGRDGGGAPIETWGSIGDWYAQVRYGTGAERRAAAQEEASLAATFGILFDEISSTITERDRIRFAGEVWDIAGAVPTSTRKGVVITASRSR